MFCFHLSDFYGVYLNQCTNANLSLLTQEKPLLLSVYFQLRICRIAALLSLWLLTTRAKQACSKINFAHATAFSPEWAARLQTQPVRPCFCIGIIGIHASRRLNYAQSLLFGSLLQHPLFSKTAKQRICSILWFGLKAIMNICII